MNGIVTTSLVRLAARRLRQISEDELDENVRKKATLCLLDVFGAIQGGLSHELAGSMRSFATQNAGHDEAYAFACGGQTSAETAAFTNSVLAHCSIRDDMHLGSVAHLGSIVVPAALALSQREGWSGERLLRAIVGGYEMGALLGTAIRESGQFNPHFRASGIVGAFAAAGAAICGQSVTDEDTAISALGLALNTACGFNAWAWSGGLEIFIHNGTAARAGITSYDLAMFGVRSSDTVLEGQQGFFALLGAGADCANLFRDWLDKSHVGRGLLEVTFKPAACCNYTQTSTAIALRVGKKVGGLAAADVESIVVTTTTAANEYPGCNNKGPVHGTVQSKMSIQYGVCVALFFAKLDLEVWDHFEDQNIVDMMQLCKVIMSSEYDEQYRKGHQSARVDVHLKDGRSFREEAIDVPWLSESEVVDRFVGEMARTSESLAQRVLAACQNLQKVANCRELLKV